MRKYYIIDTVNATEQEISDALNTCIGLPETQRYSLDGTLLYFKCDSEHEHICEHITEYTYEEILVILNTPAWQEEEIF